MALEFNKLVAQVQKMGMMLEQIDFDMGEGLLRARERFINAPDMMTVRERIDWIRQPDISGYRGAAPVDLPDAEQINAIVPPPELPPSGTLIAADGSQIYPDELTPIHYFLINIGIFTYHYGTDLTPEPETHPMLFYHESHVHDKYGRLVRNRTVDDRRTVFEMQSLGEKAWQLKGEARPLIALYDNRLMFMPGGADENEAKQTMKEYRSALVNLHDARAILAGYIDNPYGSKRFIQLLYLLSLESFEELKINQYELANAGDMSAVRDREFFDMILKPGERSAIMVQNSPQNKEYRGWGENYEIAFFYLKVANEARSRVVRVDIPVWVARDRQAVDELHALVLAQCRLQGRNPYPYVLTRADELAVVQGKDKDKLESLINAQIRLVKGDLVFRTLTAKSWGKDLARGEKQGFEV